jgi:hypothetical protein
MPWGIAAAVVGGVISANASSKASKAQANSARESSDAQLQAQRESIDFQREQADLARADREPWRLVGVNKLAELNQRVGQGGDLSRKFGMSDFEADPGYAFRQAEGMKGLTNSAAARGGLLSGAALKAASAYNQNLASAEYGNAYNRFETNNTNQFNRLASLANVGQVAANQNASGAMQLGQNVGNGMMNTGMQIGNNLIGAGNARASGYLAQGNALSGALNAGVSAWNQYNNNQPPPERAGGTSGGGNLDYWRGSNG